MKYLFAFFLIVAFAAAESPHLDGDQLAEIVGKDSPNAFVKFYAPWCGHCKKIAPVWNELAVEFGGSDASILQIDCTVHKAACQYHGVRGYPTLLLFNGNDGENSKFFGARTLDNLKTFVTENTGIAAKKGDVKVPPAASTKFSYVGKSPAVLAQSGSFLPKWLNIRTIVIFVAVGVLTIWLLFPSHGVQAPRELSVMLRGTEEEGATPIYRSLASPHQLTEYPSPDVMTLYDNFLHGLRMNNGDNPCMGYRPMSADGKAGPYQWLSYSQVNKRAESFGSGLIEADLIPVVDGMRMLALYAKNRMEWVIAEQACYKYGACTVPFYDTLGPSSVAFILGQTQLTTVVCARESIENILQAKKECKSLQHVIQIEEKVDAEDKAACKAAGLTLWTFAQLEELGAKNPSESRPPLPDDIATFCYTSGTTGDPKGALLSHRNCVSNVAAVQNSGVFPDSNDIHLSYLPLAHVFERIVQAAVYYGGGRVGFYQGSTLKLLDDLSTLRPTIFPSVPRLLNKVYDKIVNGANAKGGLLKKLFQTALAAKLEGLKKGKNKHWLWDRLVFKKVAKKVGLDRCRLMVTGSAPIAPHVMQFLRVCFSTTVLEGYGQTETAAAATVSHVDDYSVGHVGGPVSCNEIRLMDVPEMGYFATDTLHGQDAKAGIAGINCRGRGEICFRGFNVFQGYYKNKAKTDEAIDADGWLHSGDIGLWTPRGQLKIIDRKKNIFKLSQGEYVAAEKIENVYLKSSYIAQCFVYGDSYQHCLVAIVVPDEEYCKSKGLDKSDEAAVKATINEELKKLAKEAKLLGFEKARDIHLCWEPFTHENGLLTPTFKLKRNQAKKAFQAEIDEMYAGLGPVAGKSGLKQGHN